MVRSSDVTYITKSTTLSLNADTYIINAVNSSVTITLPLILADGMNYRLIRIDTSANLVTIQPTNPNQIISNIGNGTTGSNLTGNVTLNKNSSMGTESYHSNWYIIGNSIPARTIFSTLLSRTATVPYIGYTNTTRSIIGIFPYLGSITENMTNIIFTVNPNTNSLTTGTVDLRNNSTSTIIASGNYSYTGTTALTTISLTTISNLPTTLTLLDLGITTNGKQLNVYSIIVK
jgi:hypothetical protein